MGGDVNCRELGKRVKFDDIDNHIITPTLKGFFFFFFFTSEPFRICSPKYLDEEFNYIENSFLNLLYPKPFIHLAKSKALKIHRSRSPTVINISSNKMKLPYKHIILPNNSSSKFIENNLNISKLATVIEYDQKAPFSIATTQRCREGRYSFPGLLHFTLDTYLKLLGVKQGGIKYHFKSLWYNSIWD